MRVNEILSESQELDEAPAGFIKQGLRKIGAKAAAKVGMKGTAASLAGKVDTGKQANQLKVDLQGYLGGTGGDLNKLDAEELRAFLKSKKMPTDAVPASGILPKKQIDDILLKTLQQSKKVAGAPKAKAQTDPAAIGSGTAPAGSAGTSAGTAQQQGSSIDANKDGKDDKTGKVIPMPTKGATAIPSDLQKQLDALTPTEKKVLAGAI